ncbi:hypothetical protein RND71_006370 [Anisodus tanguticus]|uniref:Uncharacterized protein n=1 Tax=Anisodus tanguticus TaxID=243964 RepID=A0AAE1SU47_9SOLA|nr:hypothetical protein RND71_006370 [Anisodus tanguticus]
MFSIWRIFDRTFQTKDETSKNWRMSLFATNTRYSLVKGERIIRYVFFAWLREFCHRERALYMVLFLCRTFGVGFTAYWISEARFMSAPNEDNISQPQLSSHVFDGLLDSIIIDVASECHRRSETRP